LSPAVNARKAVTPGSVKVLMLVEAGIIGFLSFWVMSEYMYNAYFRSYADQILLDHVTTLTAIVGLAIGVAGSAVAVTFYKNLQNTRLGLENVGSPRIRGAVEKVVPTSPEIEVSQAAPASNLPESEHLEEFPESQVEAFDTGAGSAPLKSESE
jgi:hypothetical protein